MIAKMLFALLFALLVAALMLSQQQQFPAQQRDSFTGNILREVPDKELDLDIGPCGGKIAVFHKPYRKSELLRKTQCASAEVDIHRVTQE